MNFPIADSFTDSLSKLTNDEQKLVKTTAFDLQVNPANPGLQFHRIDKAKDPSFWSIRVSRDIRVSGSAGTGKTIVALHRAVHLAKKYEEARILLTTFSEPLARALKTKLRRLISNQPHIGERLETYALDGIAACASAD